MFSFSTGSLIDSANPYHSPSILGHDNGENIFARCHHHQDLTTNAHFLAAPVAINNAPPALEYTNIFIKDRNHLINCDPLMINLVPRWKKPAPAHHLSKDRHSKIVTAHGPRDRRVRLSIQIARKFFDLQDTLGFDRASKTLDWLFTKSKSAIEDLVKMKHSCCTAQDTGTNIGDNLKNNSASSVTKKKRNISMQHQQQQRQRRQQNSTTFPLLARSDSRAKARERARERTKQKMSIRKLNESKKLAPDSGPHIPNHSSCWNQLSSHNSSRMVPYFNVGTEISQTIAESILLKRKELKPFQSFSTYQQNLINSKQVSLNSPNVTEDWDIGNSLSQAIPSTTPDFPNCGKMWEVYNCKIMSQE